jgi:hypothetical protein
VGYPDPLPFPFVCVTQLLESGFLISSSCVLLSGMVFSSRGFPPGSVGYQFLVVICITIIFVATATFTGLLGFEMYRSIIHAEALRVAKQVCALGVSGVGAWCRSLCPSAALAYNCTPRVYAPCPAKRPCVSSLAGHQVEDDAVEARLKRGGSSRNVFVSNSAAPAAGTSLSSPSGGAGVPGVAEPQAAPQVVLASAEPAQLAASAASGLEAAGAPIGALASGPQAGDSPLTPAADVDGEGAIAPAPAGSGVYEREGEVPTALARSAPPRITVGDEGGFVDDGPPAAAPMESAANAAAVTVGGGSGAPRMSDQAVSAARDLAQSLARSRFEPAAARSGSADQPAPAARMSASGSDANADGSLRVAPSGYGVFGALSVMEMARTRAEAAKMRVAGISGSVRAARAANLANMRQRRVRAPDLEGPASEPHNGRDDE